MTSNTIPFAKLVVDVVLPCYQLPFNYILFLYLLLASSFQDVPKVKEEEDDRSMILTQRPTTEQPTTHSTTTAPYNTTTAAPTMTAPTTTHIPAVRSGPLIIPYPSNDHVFIGM